MGTNDPTIEASTHTLPDKKLPIPSTMKFAVSFVVLALVVCAQSQQYSGNKLFSGDADLVQGSLEDIANAGADLTKMETKLETVVNSKADIEAAETTLQTAVDKTVYSQAWKPAGTR